jgi:general secretion pathway protein G
MNPIIFDGLAQFRNGLASPTGRTTLRARWMRRRPKVRNGELGFTLVEILVVITIIGLIMGLVGPRVLNYLGESKSKAARIQIESLASALDLYYLDNGRYPTFSEGLAALVQRSGNVPTWNGSYLKGGLVPGDPWGEALHLSVTRGTWDV